MKKVSVLIEASFFQPQLTCKNTAKVSLLTTPLSTDFHSALSSFLRSITSSALPPREDAVELTKWGVAARRLEERSSSVSPVWRARQFSLMKETESARGPA